MPDSSREAGKRCGKPSVSPGEAPGCGGGSRRRRPSSRRAGGCGAPRGCEAFAPPQSEGRITSCSSPARPRQALVSKVPFDFVYFFFQTFPPPLFLTLGSPNHCPGTLLNSGFRVSCAADLPSGSLRSRCRSGATIPAVRGQSHQPAASHSPHGPSHARPRTGPSSSPAAGRRLWQPGGVSRAGCPVSFPCAGPQRAEGVSLFQPAGTEQFSRFRVGEDRERPYLPAGTRCGGSSGQPRAASSWGQLQPKLSSRRRRPGSVISR